MTKINNQEIIKQALIIETQERTAFIEQIEDKDLKKQIEFLLQDDQALTEFLIQTSDGSHVIENILVKDFQAGDKIKQFIIKRLIAKGGMGSVYLAYDEKLKRNVAIKTIRSEYLKNPATQQRFKQEAQILSQINHPAICQIYDYIDSEDGNLLVLELVEGQTLKSVNLTNKEKIDAFIQIASALEEAHSKGIVHRDLKPDNIMIDANGKLKVLDFGIAKSSIGKLPNNQEKSNQSLPENHEDGLTKDGSMIGTLLYMSPEQAACEEVTPASDIYSFGIIMQELLIGFIPYNVDKTDNLFKQVVSADNTLTDEVPKDFRCLVKNMTHKEPSKRPTSKDIKAQLLKIKALPTIRRRNLSILLLLAFVFVVVGVQWYKFTVKQNKIKFISDVQMKIHDLQGLYEKIYTLPLHNIGSDLDNIKQRKKQLEKLISLNPDLGINEKNRLLGLLNYANNEYQKALVLLEKVWKSGDHDSHIASLLTEINLHLYYKKTKNLVYKKGYEDSKDIEQLRAQFITPAKYYYKHSEAKTQLSSISKALLAWNEMDYKKALQLLQEIIDEEDWQYQAYYLKGDILRDLGQSLFEKGEREKAVEKWKQAKETYIQSNLRGRSYAQGLVKICALDVPLMNDAITRTGEDFKQFFESAVSNCEKAIVVDPENVQPYLGLATIYNNYAYGQLTQGENPLTLLEKSLSYANKAMSIEPSYAIAFSQGNSYSYRAQYKNDNGLNPLADYNKAIESFKKALTFQTEGTNTLYTNIMYTYLLKLEYEHNLGVDPNTTLLKLVELYDLSNQANNAKKSDIVLRNTVMALAYGYLADYLMLSGSDPTTALLKTQKYVKISQTFSKEFVYGNSIEAETLSYLIIYQIKNQQPVHKELDRALKLINQSVNTIRNNSFLEVKAKLLALQQYQLKDDIKNYSNAIKLFQEAIKINPKAAKTQMLLAQTYWFKAKNKQSKVELKKSIDLGIEACKEAININKNYSYAYYNYGRLLILGINQGVYSSSKKQSAQEFLQKAESINPLLKNKSIIY